MQSQYQIISWEDLLDNADEKSCYIILKDLVYDTTYFLSKELEYKDILLRLSATKDCEQELKSLNENLYNLITEQKQIVGKIENKPQSEYFKKKIRFLKADYLQFTLEEVSKHNKIQDLWVVLDNNVYDLTEYQFIHPGRPDSIHPYAGKDATIKFNDVSKHTSGARKFRENYRIGSLKQ